MQRSHKAYGGVEQFWEKPLGQALRAKAQGDHINALGALVTEAQHDETILRSVFVAVSETAQQIYQNHFTEEESYRFLTDFGVFWFSIQGAMPLTVAEDLYGLLQKNQLMFFSTDQIPEYNTISKKLFF